MPMIKAPHNGQKININAASFTELCVAIHTFNYQWWIDPVTGEKKERNVGEMIALMHSELSEALEAHRKDLHDDKLPLYHGIDVELVDCIIRAMDLLGARYTQRDVRAAEQYTPGMVFFDKCAYNSTRADHRPENRLTPHGKKY